LECHSDSGVSTGEGTPSKPKPMQEDKEEEVTPPPLSPLRGDLPSLGDIFHRQMGVIVDARRSKWTQTEIGLSAGSPPQPRLMLQPLCLAEPTHLFRIS
jgi:hypothetical protein